MADYEDRHRRALLDGGWIPAQPDAGGLPDIPAENRAFAQFALVLLLAVGLIAALYAYLASPAAYSLRTGGLGRFVTLRRFYAAPPPELQGRPYLLGLGDSLTLEGVDCRLLDELAGPGAVPTYNLSQPNKVDASYLIDLQQPVVQHAQVVLLVGPATTFSQGERTVPENQANMLRLLGFPLDRPGLEQFAGLAPGSGVDYLLAPRYLHVLDSRWRIAADFEKRLKLLAPWVPPATKDATRALDQGYATDLKSASLPLASTPQQMQRSLAQRLSDDPGLFDGGFRPSPGALAAFGFVLQRLAAGTQGVVLVIAPLHPLLQAQLGQAGTAQFRRQIEGYAGPRVRVLDLGGLLDAADFRDELHPDAAGAEKITRALARALQAQPAGN
jgi:hypothetical protein